MNEKFFKISSGLKNLIGSDLITDNFVAVFELVKNSFDANATEVKITFEDIYSKTAKIIIQDNGDGMDYDDLTKKWLFVAYSTKRDEDLKPERIYAGAKGVGRFSCDRLGRYLNLITVKNKVNSKIENLIVDWKKFELDQSKEFSTIPVDHQVLKKTDYTLKKGTVLEITGIAKDFWNRENFKKLKEKLSKLIRPDLNPSNQVQKFKIILSVPDEEVEDREVLKKLKAEKNNQIQLYYNTINGEIKNFVFTELDIKTTKIEAKLDDQGTITTKLTDRENFIYEIQEKSGYNLLSNIDITLYFLNRSAKVIFGKRTGVEHIDYGSVFIYKNGFRVYPYGERRDDSLGLENRALQGYARYIGLRSLIGEISIKGKNAELRETTSRGDGLVKTKTFNQLVNTEDGYLIKTLRRLERYVVEVTQWGVNNEDETENLSSEKVKENLVKLIANISDDKSILSLNYNKNIIDLIAGKEEKSAKKLVRNFKRIAAESNDKKLLKDAANIEKAISSSIKRVASAEKELTQKISEKKQVESELERRVEQLSIATSIASQDLNNVTNLHHQVRVLTDVIKTELLLFSRRVERGEKLSNQEIKDFINKISFENSKIESISKFGSRAIFQDFTSSEKADIVGFIENYVKKISNYFSSSRLKVQFHAAIKGSFELKFRPLDISIIIDNMISNSKKAEASLLDISIESISDKSIELIFKDNGKGLNREIKDVALIFEKGFSTTKSTGLGLFHVFNLIEDYKWNIKVNTRNQKGFEVTITIKK
jgi:signal transduction histidine kinase